MEQFKKLGLGKEILKVIAELGFEKPTEIQEKAIPLVLTDSDIIGNSATGSGKTLAFGSAIIEKSEVNHGIQSLVLTPTRELAVQVAQHLRMFSKYKHLKIQEVYGGVSINTQIRGLERAEVVVGTPGRILDHLKRRTLNLSKIRVLVLDEVDRMVDMGFLPDVEEIIRRNPKERQTLLFSATNSADVNYVAGKYLKNPKRIVVESFVDPKKLNQHYYDVPSEMKFSLLVHLLKNDNSKLVMVFCNTRRNSDFVARNLQKNNLDAVSIHGGLTQARRTAIMKKFYDGKLMILVCTDVAARGLDINNVTHVYNYDIPKNSTEYIHRIGRTARAGKSGAAVSLITSRDYRSFSDIQIEDSLKIENNELPDFKKVDSGRMGDFRRENFRGRFDNSKRNSRGRRERSPRSDGFNRGGSDNQRSEKRSFAGRRERNPRDNNYSKRTTGRDSRRNPRGSRRRESFHGRRR